MLQRVETDSVVNDLEPGDVTVITVVDRERQPGTGGVGMFDDVLQTLLGDSVQREFDVVGQALIGEIDVDADLRDRACQAGESAGEPQIVEHRWPQPADGGAGFLQRQRGQLARPVELLGERGTVVDGLGGRVEPVGQRDQPLGDAVVDVAGQPPPLESPEPR